jgi:membrane protein
VGAVVVVVVLGALALTASVVGGHAPPGVIAAVGVPASLAVLTVGITTLYWFSVGATVRARRLVPGAAFAALGVVVSLYGLASYLALSTRYTALYGAFAGLVIGMIGAYISVYAVLLGAVLDARLNEG